jgi:anion-transporting  ArsA/GET3 family ATPase
MTSQFKCEYCEKVLSSNQGLKVHQARTKKCLEIQNRVQAEKEKYGISTEGVVPPSENVIRHLESSDSRVALEMLKKENEELRKLLKEKDNTIKSFVQQSQEVVSKNKKYIDFYMKYSGKDDALEYYDDIGNYMKLCEYIQKKIEQEGEDLKTSSFYARLTYDFFFDKYWKCADRKRMIFKYKDIEGNVVIDDELQRLFRIVKGAVGCRKDNGFFNTACAIASQNSREQQKNIRDLHLAISKNHSYEPTGAYFC